MWHRCSWVPWGYLYCISWWTKWVEARVCEGACHPSSVNVKLEVTRLLGSFWTQSPRAWQLVRLELARRTETQYLIKCPFSCLWDQFLKPSDFIRLIITVIIILNYSKLRAENTWSFVYLFNYYFHAWLALNLLCFSRVFCFYLPHIRIISMCHHTWFM